MVCAITKFASTPERHCLTWCVHINLDSLVLDNWQRWDVLDEVGQEGIRIGEGLVQL